MICNKIQALEYPSGMPSELFTGGALFLDVGLDFGIRQTRQGEELNEINKITVSASLPIVLPYTTKNFMVLGKYINPNVHDFDFKPLPVIAYSANNVITHSLLYVLEHDESNAEGSFVCELRDDESHWAVASKKKKLNSIEFDPFIFNRGNVEGLWALNEYNDGDPGINFPLIYFGAWKEIGYATLSDMRPLYSVMYLLKKGLASIGWVFKSPIFDLPIGKKLWAYLLEPFDVNKQQKDRPYTFSASLSSEIPFTVPEPNYHIIFDAEEYDDNNVYDNAAGTFSGQGIYDFYFDIYFKNLFDPQANISYRFIKESGGVKTVLYERADWPDPIDDNGVISHRLGNSISRVSLIPSDSVYVEVDIPGQGEVLSAGYFSNRNNGFILNGDETILPNVLIGEKYRLYDLITGIAHLFRAKIHTDNNLREFWIYPNYKTKWWDDEIEGYYLDETEDIRFKEVIDSSRVKSQAQTGKRYLRFQFKSSTDVRINGLGFPDAKPIFSKTVDLGENFENDLEVYENPFFEPTVNDKVYSIRPSIIAAGNEYHIDMPFMVDNDEGLPSFEIQPRILIFHGTDAYKGKDGQSIAWRWYDTLQTGLPYASQLPNLLDASEQPIKEILVYGDQKEDLYSRFWKRWVYDRLVNTIVSILAYIKPTDFFGFNFRKTYHFFSNGKSVFGRLLAINDFDGCGNTVTPIDFIPSTGNVKAPVLEERSNPDYCGGQNPILIVNKSGTVYTASADNSAVTDTITSQYFEWRYFDTATWTSGNVVTDPTKPFYIRMVTVLALCGTKYRTKYFSPCDNKPVIIWSNAHRDPSDLTKWCITADIGGIINDPILTNTYTYSLHGLTPVSYTMGTEICGITSDPAEIDLHIEGETQFDNDCDPEPVEGDYEFPPIVVNCLDNNPTVTCQHIGNGMFTFAKGGTQVSPLSVWFIQYRKPGETDLDWIIWDHHTPAPVPGTVESRGVFFFCDTCPPICTDVVTCMEPMMIPGMISEEDLNPVSAMSKAWNWDKASAAEKKKFKKLYYTQDAATICTLHNRLHLSDIEYCCGPHLEYALKHVKHAIDNNLI
jgi:hypothetical protein